MISNCVDFLQYFLKINTLPQIVFVNANPDPHGETEAVGVLVMTLQKETPVLTPVYDRLCHVPRSTAGYMAHHIAYTFCIIKK